MTLLKWLAVILGTYAFASWVCIPAFAAASDRRAERQAARDIERAGRQAAAAAEAFVAALTPLVAGLTPDEVAEILAGPDWRTQ